MKHGDDDQEIAPASPAQEQDGFQPGLAAVKLRPPRLPSSVSVAPEPAGQKLHVLQELAAIRQSIHDDFLKGKLKLKEVQGRLEEELAAVSGNAPAAATPSSPPPLPVPEPGPAPREPLPRVKTAAIPSAESAPRAAAEKPGPAPRPRYRPFTPKVLGSILALGLAAAALLKFHAGSAAVARFPLPPTRAAGLCLDPSGARIFFADPGRQLLFEASAADGQIGSVRSFPAAGLTGLAFDGAWFWSTDGTAVYRHNAADDHAVAKVYKAAGALLLCWDEGKLWAAAAGKLRRYSAGVTLAEDGIFPMPAGDTAGISVTRGKLWLFDPGNGRLSGYILSTPAQPEETADLKPWLPREGAVSGFTLRGNYAWLVTENPAALIRVDLGQVKFIHPRGK